MAACFDEGCNNLSYWLCVLEQPGITDVWTPGHGQLAMCGTYDAGNLKLFFGHLTYIEDETSFPF